MPLDPATVREDIPRVHARPNGTGFAFDCTACGTAGGHRHGMVALPAIIFPLCGAKPRLVLPPVEDPA